MKTLFPEEGPDQRPALSSERCPKGHRQLRCAPASLLGLVDSSAKSCKSCLEPVRILSSEDRAKGQCVGHCRILQGHTPVLRPWRPQTPLAGCGSC